MSIPLKSPYDFDSRPTEVIRQGVRTILTRVIGKPATFGEIDNLAFTYSGSRLKKVDDAAAAVIYAGASDFNDGAHNTAICFPEFYYVNTDTLYVIDKNGFFNPFIKSCQFVIQSINLVSPPDLILGVSTSEGLEKFEDITLENERTRTSIKDRSNNIIRISDYASGITIYNTENEVIARDVNQFV
ncbi:MAG: hypothetical protein K2J10_05500, partial [Muribaculaceae bacterium]|nr:hypothetical protein [Muribaculaceae bacterium]